MTDIECFKLEESVYNPGKYLITPVHENFFLKSTNGSYNVIPARLMNLTYAQYLRFCRDIVGAELAGKNKLYVIPYFKKTDRAQVFVRLLNSRANLVIWEKEHQDWEKHLAELENWEKEKEELKNALKK